MPKKFVEKKKSKKNFFFCETEKLDYPRFLGVFYYHGTMNLPCIREPTSIRNWVTFCGPAPQSLAELEEKPVSSNNLYY